LVIDLTLARMVWRTIALCLLGRSRPSWFGDAVQVVEVLSPVVVVRLLLVVDRILRLVGAEVGSLVVAGSWIGVLKF